MRLVTCQLDLNLSLTPESVLGPGPVLVVRVLKSKILTLIMSSPSLSPVSRPTSLFQFPQRCGKVGWSGVSRNFSTFGYKVGVHFSHELAEAPCPTLC